jgi:glutamate dehydrogenase
MAMAWKTQLKKKLLQQYGDEKGTELSNKYNKGLPSSYMDDYSVELALKDISYIETLGEDNRLAMYLCIPQPKKKKPLHLRFFQWEKLVPLSDILPILENFDLLTENERPHKLNLGNKQFVWISDFAVRYPKDVSNLEKGKVLFQDALFKVYSGEAENDGFNKLVLSALLSWQEIVILRTYAKYLLQIGFRFSQHYLEKTLVNNSLITRDLVQLFKMRHDPEIVISKKKHVRVIKQRILRKLDLIPTFNEDYIIRRLLDLIKATLRTNFFQHPFDNQEKGYLAIKFDSGAIPELPLPVPMYEIFVYSPRFEAIHLRKEKIARGGIRWSDRSEDFRTEILGLMKAQVVKNTAIVPSGAKGGFVVKKIPASEKHETVQQSVVQCYKSFIRALLDLTDNIKDDKYFSPPSVVCYDDIDPYLVVAADKGTTTFSDLANSISKEYNFWLGDAFASGGSTGYDHKKMGITACGTWESIKRHFRELETNVDKKNITVIGIGDMSGDVFGNGMLFNNRIKLIAAFDHRHIFIDPDPDPQKSYKERKRLFKLPTSSWEDYNAKLISPGGGVFKRSLKSITLTPQMKQVLHVANDALPPNEFIKVLLKAPVDLLFNGGVGTYVKSYHETSMAVGDRTNDYCRINGNELHCKVVGEGGNLGFTQLGRVEYALNGGLIYTDFIDNSAGVDCSDHEVNLKILLDKEASKGMLTQKERNKLLASLTEDVARLVLEDNYHQALALSFALFYAKKNIGFHIDYIKELESKGVLNREVDFLPDDKELVERKAAGLSLTQPELAILFAHTKIYIKQQILKTDLVEDPFFLEQFLETAFPHSIRKQHRSAIYIHPLKKDIIATQLSNEVVNKMGIIFFYRMQIETGASIEEIIRAFTIAWKSFNIQELQQIIEELDFKILFEEQFDLLQNLHNLVNLSTRWFLHRNYKKEELQELIAHYSAGIKSIERLVPDLMTGMTRRYMVSLTEKFLQAKLPLNIAQRFAVYRAIYTSLNIIEVATRRKTDLEKTAKIYFSGGERMNLVWFRDQFASDKREDHWHILTRLILRDELDILQQAITVGIMKESITEEDPKILIDMWIKNNQRIVKRWEQFLAILHSSATVDYTMFFIAIRELTQLLENI